MAITTDPLQQLKDIHLPQPISAWPQAPGWYFLAVIVILLMGIISFYGLKKYYRYRRRKKVHIELQAIIKNFERGPSESFELLSRLVRRIALARYKREHVASLRGEAWLKFLDDVSKTEDFTKGVGRILITAPYQKVVKTDIKTLHDLITQLIKKVL